LLFITTIKKQLLPEEENSFGPIGEKNIARQGYDGLAQCSMLFSQIAS
jgi:hypothetical protein